MNPDPSDIEKMSPVSPSNTQHPSTPPLPSPSPDGNPSTPSTPSPLPSSTSNLLRNTIIGLADGLTVPFALTAGLSSLGSPKLVILAGLAELFAGAIAMGLGAYLAAATERKRYVVEEERVKGEFEEMTRRNIQGKGKGGGAETAETTAEVDKGEEEVRAILGRFGIGGEEAKGVVEGLRNREDGWVQFRLEVGLGLERRGKKGEWVEGLTMGLAYFLGGLLPMIPYFAFNRINYALFTSIGITGAILVAFGFVKARYMTGTSYGDAAWSALQTLVVGAMAAAVSYGIVRGVNSAHSV